MAQSPFDGTWKMDASKAKWTDKPAEAVLAGGMYECVTCTPAYKIKADGTYHSRPGGGVDETSVQIINDRSVKFASRKAGTLVGESLVTISADGNTRTVEAADYAPNGIVTRYSTTQRRVGAAPAGAHQASGKWLMDRINSASDEQMLMTFKVDGDKLNMSTPDGYSYAAQFGGAAVPVGGDRFGGKVQLRKLSANSFEEINLRDGKVRSVSTITRTPEGRLHMKSENKLNGAVEEFEFAPQ
ncbi:hypothetical protein [Sphingomonas glaciei]|uniref:Uncharacterized protein n=1 Tax=Sphingomonas glaciei TaxID=2938948 RepID=A0ABY5MRP0_9SPHN|nr:hypothetical protein [Sphingomonas glaciei]UUR07150.1 hypothetical protein M1K48_09330 [Sphingomonas glaciei]